MRNISIAVVGIGPWGLAVLDRLLAKAHAEPTVKFDVTLVNPSQPGPGMHTLDQPDYLLLNTVTAQINSFSAHQFGEPDLKGALNFLDWVRETLDPECPADGFLPRNTFGKYLNFVYSVLKRNLPKNLRWTEHRSVAKSLQTLTNSKFMLTGSNCLNVKVDHVFICTGHGIPIMNPEGLDANILTPYPIKALHYLIAPNACVGVMGMGLTAVDVVASLTEGRGGSFKLKNNGDLRYLSSGEEPTIYVFSRTGIPFSCRPSSSLDLSNHYQPIFCHETTLPTDRQLDFRSDLFPQIKAEMWAAYTIRRTYLTSGESAAAQQRNAFESLTPIEAVKLGQSLYGSYTNFDPEALLLGEPTKPRQNAFAISSCIVGQLSHDITEAIKGEARSPYKHAIEMLRVMRNFIRAGVNHQRLTPVSQVEFFTRIAPRISQLIVGPPISRGREWLALIKAGVLRLDIGASPKLHRNTSDGLWVARSLCNDQPLIVQFDHLIKGYMSSPLTNLSTSPLLSNMVKSGMCTLINAPNYQFLLVDKKARPIDATGLTISGVSVLGVPSEGSTYFNHYLPSPRSRAQAFEQANMTIENMLKTTQNTE